MMFAQSLFDFGISETALQIVKIIGAVGGALVGWFVTDPLTRLVYRLSFKGPTPPYVLFLSKGAGSATMALILYFAIHFGGGGGIGFGPGPGGLPGKGQGVGGDKGVVPNNGSKDSKPPQKDKLESPKKGIESIDIEIISIKRFDDIENERYFLVKRTEPPLTPTQLEDYFKKNHANIEVTPVMTTDSIGEMADDNPLSQLLALTKKYSVKTLQTKRP